MEGYIPVNTVAGLITAGVWKQRRLKRSKIKNNGRDEDEKLTSRVKPLGLISQQRHWGGLWRWKHWQTLDLFLGLKKRTESDFGTCFFFVWLTFFSSCGLRIDAKGFQTVATHHTTFDIPGMTFRLKFSQTTNTSLAPISTVYERGMQPALLHMLTLCLMR